MKKLVFIIIFQLLMTFSCRAATVHVPGDYPTIQAGINAALNGDTVLVASGVYSGDGNCDITFPPVSLTVKSESGPEECIIDCQGSSGNEHRGFFLIDNNSYTKTIEGFTIINGYVRQDGNNEGGAIVLNNDSAIIENCVITNCNAETAGAIFAVNCDNLIISRCTISNNLAVSTGACRFQGQNRDAIWIDQTEISSNESLNDAALYCQTPVYLTNSIVRNNTIETGTAAVYSSAIIEIKNTLVVYNTAGMELENGGTLFFCTVAYNPASSDSIAGIIKHSGLLFMKNCIIWANSDNSELSGNPDNYIVSYCDIQGGFPGSNNMDADPDFTSDNTEYFYLSQTSAGQSNNSPCVDAGSNYAFNICIDTPFDRICMNDLTTRTDDITDSLTADLGYHYIPPPQPPQPTPTMTPPPTATPVFGVDLTLNQSTFHSGDDFLLKANLHNYYAPQSVNLTILLDVHGEYFFYPDWEQSFDTLTLNLDTGMETRVILSFIWPDVPGSESDLAFYGAFLNDEFSSILGIWSVIPFGWE